MSEVIIPCKDGPIVQPKSPAKASIPNILVPPREKFFPAKEYTPGHIIPTNKPPNAIPASDKYGMGEREASRYAPVSNAAHIAIASFKFILSPKKP